MSLWTESTDHNLGTYEERLLQTINLPVDSSIDSITLISGKMPGGLRIVDTTLVGTPFEVKRTQTFRFVLRANKGLVNDDLTFRITITGADAPVWVTNEGGLPIGPNNKFYVLDSSPVDFQLQAIDPDLPAGDELEYYIADGDGVLPPGLKLTTDGKIVGIVDPILALEKSSGEGFYDQNAFGDFPYDFGVLSVNGYQSYFYDTVKYDTNTPTRAPRKLNRFYQFTVSVSDGVTVTKRQFDIYLVGDDFLRADNTVMQVGTGLFTADNTNTRRPIWLTPGNIGYRRASNFLTIYMDVYDTQPEAGNLSFVLQDLNDDGSVSTLPPGLTLDSSTGEIAGYVPYQPAVTRPYKFTIRAQKLNLPETAFADKTFTVNILGEVDSTIKWITDSDIGTIRANFVSTLKVEAETSVPNATLFYSIQDGKLPPGLSLSISGEIIGNIRQFPTAENPGLTVFDNKTTTFDNNVTTTDRSYKFTVKAQDQFGFSGITREFTIGAEDPDNTLYSNLYMQPLLPKEQKNSFRTFVSDPNIFNPDLIYRPNDPQFGLQNQVKMLAYAGIETKNINEYVSASAKNHKRKKYRLGDVKTAIAKIPGTNDILYEVIYVEVIDPQDSSAKTKKSFSIDTKNKITVDSVALEVADDNSGQGTGVGTFPITLRDGTGFSPASLGSISIITREGIVVFTGTDVSVELRDSAEVTVASITQTSQTEPERFRPISNTIKIDSDAIKVSDGKDRTRYISNITNMRNEISKVGETEREFLPLWMRTSQTIGEQELGYVPAIPLVYCKPGTSGTILLNIQNSNYDFKTLDFEVDRYVIDSTTGISRDQYILFANYQYNV